MAEILCVRHGQASFAAADYDQLSELGYLQANLLGQFLVKSETHFDRIYSGTLKRQIQTAETVRSVYQEHGLDVPEIEQDDRWNELQVEDQIKHLAPRLQQSMPQIETYLAQAKTDKKAFQKLIRATFDYWLASDDPNLNIESWRQAHTRVTSALADVHHLNGSGTKVGLFTSGGIIAILSAHVLGMPSSGVYPLFEKLINCSITRLLHNPDQIALSTFNEHAYLQAIADPTDQAKVITYR